MGTGPKTGFPAEPTSLADALAQFDQLWSPHVVATVNDYDVRVVKVAGEFVWHAHHDTDEFFLVLDGELRIALRAEPGERAVVLSKGSVFVAPRGTEHKPSSEHGASVLLFEPTGTMNVGDRRDKGLNAAARRLGRRRPGRRVAGRRRSR